MWRSFYHLNPKINTVVVRIPLRNDDDDSSEKLRSKPLSIVELEKSHGNGEFTRTSGCELDLSDKPVGLGIRSRRYALLAEDGVVKVLNLEEGGAFTFSGAEDILKLL